MKGCLKGCLGRFMVGAAAVGVVGAAVVLGPRYLPLLGDRGGVEGSVTSPSAEIADRALDRIDRLREGGEGGTLSLGSTELTSIVRYALPGFVPEGVTSPTVALREGRVVLSGRVATAAFPDVPPLDEVLGMMPDTVEVRLRASLLPFDEDEAALHVDRVQAILIPLPERFIPPILGALGRTDREGLPRDAISVRLPGGLSAAYVLRDSLVLVAAR